MKKYLSYVAVVFFLSLVTISITIFIYSPQFAKERILLSQKIKSFKNIEKKVEFDEGAISTTPSSTITPTPLVSNVVVIVLDDFGYEGKLIDTLGRLAIPVNPSIIPFLPFSEEVLKKAKQYGLDPMLHLPMEPLNPSLNPGKDAIFTRLSDEEIKKRTKDAIDSLPGIIGVNNHMGSRATTSQRVMKDVIDVVKSYHLFFLDSLTSSSSVGYKVAVKEGLPLLKRDVFLDNYKEDEYIENQFETLIELALKRKKAIGIGHANKVTISVLEKFIPIFKEKGIKIISIKEYVEHYYGKN